MTENDETRIIYENEIIYYMNPVKSLISITSYHVKLWPILYNLSDLQVITVQQFKVKV